MRTKRREVRAALIDAAALRGLHLLGWRPGLNQPSTAGVAADGAEDMVRHNLVAGKGQDTGPDVSRLHAYLET